MGGALPDRCLLAGVSFFSKMRLDSQTPHLIMKLHTDEIALVKILIAIIPP